MLQYISISLSIGCLILSILIFTKVNKKCEKYSENSIDCAYGLGGGNTAYCNDWLNAYRKGEKCISDDDCHPNIFGEIDCQKAMKCCNQINTCNNGKKCVNENLPTKNNNLKYDRNIVLDS